MTRPENTPPRSRRERRAQQRLDHPAERPRKNRRVAPRPAWQSPIVLVSVLAVLVTAAVIYLAIGSKPAATADLVTPPTSYAADITDGGTLGSKDAPVVIELFSDFQCPACKLFVTQQMPRLLEDFIRPGVLRVEARDIDIIGSGSANESIELAAGAFCAGEQDRYWHFHDLVFWNQGRENRGDHDARFIANVADQAGVAEAAWQACIARTDIRKPITDLTASAAAVGINSTPTLRINGTAMVGVPDYDELASLIRQLAAAASPTTAPSVNASPAPVAS
jgi:protein-disulfide isomerase